MRPAPVGRVCSTYSLTLKTSSSQSFNFELWFAPLRLVESLKISASRLGLAYPKKRIGFYYFVHFFGELQDMLHDFSNFFLDFTKLQDMLHFF